MIIDLDRLFVASRWNKFLTKPLRLNIFFIEFLKNSGGLEQLRLKKLPGNNPNADFIELFAVVIL